jgi:pimeloyl-ACP methyl ester carboxylesterase
MTGRRISSLTAAALCVGTRGTMTPRQIVNVDLLKATSAEFATMRGLAMRFAGLLRGSGIGKLDVWLRDARHCGLYAMRTVPEAEGIEVLRPRLPTPQGQSLERWLGAYDLAVESLPLVPTILVGHSLGAAFALLLKRTGHLAPAVAAHVAYNAVVPAF